MNPLTLWITIVLAGVVTFGLRYSFIALVDTFGLPAAVRRGLRFVPVAVFSAIILPEIVVQGGTIDLALANLELWAGVVAAAVAWRTHNVLYTLIAGMAVLWLLKLATGLT